MPDPCLPCQHGDHLSCLLVPCTCRVCAAGEPFKPACSERPGCVESPDQEDKPCF